MSRKVRLCQVNSAFPTRSARVERGAEQRVQDACASRVENQALEQTPLRGLLSAALEARIQEPIMSAPISYRLFLDYLQCRYKAYLKLSGKSGIKHDFEKFQDEKLIAYRLRAREHFLQRNQIIAPPEAISQFKDIKKYKPVVAASVSIVNERHALIIDAVEISSSQSSAEKPIYQPLIFLPDHNITKQHKLLLAFYGMVLSDEQKAVPTYGRIISGYQFSSSKTQLISLIKEAGKIEKEILKMMDLISS